MDKEISYTAVAQPQDTPIEEQETNSIPEEQVQQDEPSTSTEGQESTVDYLGMSDEEFLKSQAEPPANVEEPTSQPTQVSSVEPQSQQNVPLDESLGKEVEPTLTPEEFHRMVTAEFTANGRQVRVEKPEDVIRLMQMGMNYNKKMEAIKPNIGLVRTLNENGITDPSQLQFLLDIQKGDKAAIAKLLHDQNVDTYDLPDLEETPYVPQSKVVSNVQANFEEVVNDVKTMPRGTELLQALGNETWDDTSIEFLQSNPEAIYLLYQDKQAGIFDDVMKTIDVDSALGRIPPEWKAKPFVELYEFVAGELAKQRTPAPTQQQQPYQQGNSVPKIVGHNQQDPNQVRRASSAPKSAGLTTGGSAQNILADVPDFLAMTDAQFEAFSKSAEGLRFN